MYVHEGQVSQLSFIQTSPQKEKQKEKGMSV